MNGITRMAQQVYTTPQQIRQGLCCNSHQSINVVDNPIDRDESIDSLVNNTPVATQPARILTNQDQGPALRDTLDNNNQDLNTYLDNWVIEVPNQREVRQRVKDQIQIINGQLVVNGDLDLMNTNISSLPQGLHVGGYLSLTGCTNLTELTENLHVGRHLSLENCTNLTTLPQDLHIGGHLILTNCTSLTVLPDWVFNTSDLRRIPANLQQTNTYKTFQILKHFDSHNSIEGIGNQELIDLYYNDQDQIDALKYNRHCFRIAYALYNNQPLTTQQQTFKDNANEETKNQIRGTLLNMITSFKSDIFKQLPGINTAILSTVRPTNGAECLSETLPFIMNYGFLTTAETQLVRMACKSFNESDILDKTRAFSLEEIEQILKV